MYIEYLMQITYLWCLYKLYIYLSFNSLSIYPNDPKYWDKQVWAYSVDPDQMLQNAASDQGRHCLPLIQ